MRKFYVKKYKDLIKIMLMLIPSVIAFIFYVTLRFKNPDMTETRLMITYWKENVVCLFVWIISAIITQNKF